MLSMLYDAGEHYNIYKEASCMYHSKVLCLNYVLANDKLHIVVVL